MIFQDIISVVLFACTQQAYSKMKPRRIFSKYIFTYKFVTFAIVGQWIAPPGQYTLQQDILEVELVNGVKERFTMMRTCPSPCETLRRTPWMPWLNDWCPTAHEHYFCGNTALEMAHYEQGNNRVSSL
jgi:hypothetical protein